MTISTAVIIAAGGSGARMGLGMPKQFLPLAGRPMLMHSIERFHQALPEAQIIVALPADCFDLWSKLCRRHDFGVSHEVVAGGATRFSSVRAALEHCRADYIAVHDGARPLISVRLIHSILDEAMRHGAAIPVLEPVDSYRMISGEHSHPVDRSCLRAVQTPQIFTADLLRRAYALPCADGNFTDDASLVEHSGHRVHLCHGDPRNIKITHPEDLAVAELLGALKE